MTEQPPDELMAFVGSFLDYMVERGWIVLTLMIDRGEKYHPIVASNFDATPEEKQKILDEWRDAIGRADDANLFLKKDIRPN